jgi:CRISPR system Cascade subunit CasA
MLVMSKNHDLKSGTLPADDAELWLYALVSLQTQEGFLGAGNYGIARMNGGFASRPALGIARDGSASARFLDDGRRAVLQRAVLSRTFGYRSAGALALTWLVPWDGTQSLPLEALDVFFIDICRRVRLVATDEGLSARVISSKAARIEAKAAKGNTGDLWTPTLSEKDETKAFTADARGWSYQQLVRLLFPAPTNKGESVTPSPLMDPAGIAATDGLSVIGRVVVRGQGKTEGYHERHVPVSGLVRAGFGRRRAADPLAAMAHARVKDAGTMVRQVLFPAMMAIFAGAPRTDAGERARDDDTTRSRAGKAAARFDTLIDADFFSDLALEAEVIDDAATSEAVRARWILERLYRAGEAVLTDAIAAAPDAAARHWRVRVQAVDVFSACFNKQFGERLRAAGLRMPIVDPSERGDDAVTTEDADA